MSQPQSKEEERKKSLLDWLQTILLPIVLGLFFRFGPATLPDWVSITIDLALITTILATALDTLYPYVKPWTQRRKTVSMSTQSSLREEFRVFILNVKMSTEFFLWQSLKYISNQPDTGTYASQVYDLLANLSNIMAPIYAEFDPSKVSHDLLESYKDRLSRISSEHAFAVSNWSQSVKTAGNEFPKAVSEMNKFLIEIWRDVYLKHRQTRPPSIY